MPGLFSLFVEAMGLRRLGGELRAVWVAPVGILAHLQMPGVFFALLGRSNVFVRHWVPSPWEIGTFVTFGSVPLRAVSICL